MISCLVRWRVAGALWLTLLGACADEPAERPRAAPGEEPRPREDRSRLAQPGREPRIAYRYAFREGSEERGRLVIESRFTPSWAPPTDERLELRFSIRYVGPSICELEILEASTSAPDIPGIESALGSRFRVAYAEPGDDAPPNVESASNADQRADQYIQGALVQLIPHLAPRLPDPPLGIGARWDSDTGSVEVISGDATSLEIERRDALSYPQPLGNGQTVSVDEEQTYRIAARTHGVSNEVEATLETRGSDGTRRSTRMRFDLER